MTARRLRKGIVGVATQQGLRKNFTAKKGVIRHSFNKPRLFGFPTPPHGKNRLLTTWHRPNGVHSPSKKNQTVTVSTCMVEHVERLSHGDRMSVTRNSITVTTATSLAGRGRGCVYTTST